MRTLMIAIQDTADFKLNNMRRKKQNDDNERLAAISTMVLLITITLLAMYRILHGLINN